jgi:hypothetical protein
MSIRKMYCAGMPDLLAIGECPWPDDDDDDDDGSV